MYDFFAPLINYFRQQVGLKADAASATGSVHAKLAFVDALIDTLTSLVSTNIPYLKSARPKYIGAISNTEGNWTTIASITGAGYLTGVLAGWKAVGQHGNLYVEITIDGTAIITGTDAPVAITETFVADTNTYFTRTIGSISCMHRFNSSCVVKMYQTNTTGTNTISGAVAYLLD